MNKNYIKIEQKLGKKRKIDEVDDHVKPPSSKRRKKSKRSIQNSQISDLEEEEEDEYEVYDHDEDNDDDEDPENDNSNDLWVDKYGISESKIEQIWSGCKHPKNEFKRSESKLAEYLPKHIHQKCAGKACGKKKLHRGQKFYACMECFGYWMCEKCHKDRKRYRN